jgi:hypothetical protein
MKLIGSVVFDEDEVEVFDRALKGHEHHLSIATDKGLRFPVRAHLTQLRQDEPFDLVALEDLGETLDELIYDWQAEVTPEAWREMGAPGADDAIEGLAQERRLAIDRAVEARKLVRDALERVIAAAPDRRISRAERKAVGA